MKGLYLSTKQLVFLAFPFIMIAFLYGLPQYSDLLTQKIEELLDSTDLTNYENYEDLVKEGFDKGYFKDQEMITDHFERHDQSIFTQDKLSTSWVIAYFYKQLSTDRSLEESQEGKIKSLSKLQATIDSRNDSIKQNISAGGLSATDQEIRFIKEIIKSRNLSPLLTEEERKAMGLELDLSRYLLQMILWNSKNPKVIINNNIYRSNDEVEKNTIIKKIERKKILLKNLKEEKWLYLNR